MEGYEKQCYLCKQVKGLAEYFKDAAAPGGYCRLCKDCYRTKRPRRTPEQARAEYQKVKARNLLDPDYKAKRAAYARKWRGQRKASNDGRHEKHLALMRRRGKIVRNEAFRQYGGIMCVCCGEADPEVLSLDHVDNDGNEHRKILGSGSPMYDGLRARNWPQIPRLQVLCMNCNVAKKHNRGIMPEWRRGINAAQRPFRYEP